VKERTEKKRIDHEQFAMFAAYAVWLKDEFDRLRHEEQKLPEAMDGGYPVVSTIEDAYRWHELKAEIEQAKCNLEEHAKAMLEAGMPPEVWVRYSPSDDRHVKVVAIPRPEKEPEVRVKVGKLPQSS
jgi:hypothetical protein